MKPVFGNINDWKAAWGTLQSIIVTVFPNELPTLAPKDRNILVSIWQDSDKVGFCTTIHNGTEGVVRNWKRPRETSCKTKN